MQASKNSAVKHSAAKNPAAAFVPDELRVASLREAVWNYYQKHARSTMPWRITPSPYFVLLSEIMSQQTQISRVEPYFTAFITRWPDIAALARAELKDVLTQWSGLGYYRRAKYLHECARAVCSKYGGEIPREKKDLMQLPGVGDYTASAVIAFAYNKPVVVLDTNVRRVMIHHFFPLNDVAHETHNTISDALVRICIEASMDRKKPRTWYWALMDYGANLAFCVQNPNRRSAAYVKQSRFEGSGRQLRAAILRSLMEGAARSARGIEAFVLADISRRRSSAKSPKKDQHQNRLFAEEATTKSSEDAALSEKRGHIQNILQTLVKEKLIVREKQRYYLG